MVPFNCFLLKLSGYNILSGSRWLENFGRISGNMKMYISCRGPPTAGSTGAIKNRGLNTAPPTIPDNKDNAYYTNQMGKNEKVCK